MKYKVECPHCEAESVIHVEDNLLPEYCPVCGDEVPEENRREYEEGCLCI